MLLDYFIVAYGSQDPVYSFRIELEKRDIKEIERDIHGKYKASESDEHVFSIKKGNPLIEKFIGVRSLLEKALPIQYKTSEYESKKKESEKYKDKRTELGVLYYQESEEFRKLHTSRDYIKNKIPEIKPIWDYFDNFVDYVFELGENYKIINEQNNSKLLVTENAFDCVIVGIFVPRTRTRALWHINQNTSSIKQQHNALKGFLDQLKKEGNDAEIAFLSGYYTDNVIVVTDIINKCGFNITYAKIFPFYKVNYLFEDKKRRTNICVYQENDPGITFKNIKKSYTDPSLDFFKKGIFLTDYEEFSPASLAIDINGNFFIPVKPKKIDSSIFIEFPEENEIRRLKEKTKAEKKQAISQQELEFEVWQAELALTKSQQEKEFQEQEKLKEIKKKRKELKESVKQQWILESKKTHNKRTKNWIIGGGIVIAGISAVAALLWSWWKNKAKTAQ